MGQHRFVFHFLVVILVIPSLSLAVPEQDDCLVALTDHVPCRSVRHPDTRRIFPCPDRAFVLIQAGLTRENLTREFEGHSEEHTMVKLAIERVKGASGLSGLQKAVLWEECAAIIQNKVGHPISESYRGLHDGNEIFIFQGTKRFEGKVYLLTVLFNGDTLVGRSDPIVDIGAWRGRLGELTK